MQNTKTEMLAILRSVPFRGKKFTLSPIHIRQCLSEKKIPQQK